MTDLDNLTLYVSHPMLNGGRETKITPRELEAAGLCSWNGRTFRLLLPGERNVYIVPDEDQCYQLDAVLGDVECTVVDREIGYGELVNGAAPGRKW